MLHAGGQHREGSRQVHLPGALALLVMGAFAILFAKERLYADAGYFLVRVIDEEGFHVINHRWLMPLIQWLPLVGVKLGLNLPAVVVLYSLGNVVLAAAAFLFTSLVLRDRIHALTLLATQFVGLAQALFCPVFELYYGAMLLVVLRAVLATDRLGPGARYGLSLLLFVLVATCHFLGLLLLLLMLTLDRIWKDRVLSASFLVALGVVMAHRFLDMSAYEGRALDTIFVRLRHEGLAWAFAPGRLWAHGIQFLSHYPEVILIGLATAWQAWRLNAWWTLTMFMGGHLVIYTLVSLYFPDGTHERYRETLDYTHVVWTLVAAAWSMEHSASCERRAFRLFPVILVLRTAWAIHVGTTFTARTAWMQERIAVAHAQGITRALDTAAQKLVPPGLNSAPLYVPAPFEYLLLSAMDGPEGTIVMVAYNGPPPSGEQFQRIEAALRKEGVMLPARADGRYFHMPEGPFTVMEP